MESLKRKIETECNVNKRWKGDEDSIITVEPHPEVKLFSKKRKAESEDYDGDKLSSSSSTLPMNKKRKIVNVHDGNRLISQEEKDASSNSINIRPKTKKQSQEERTLMVIVSMRFRFIAEFSPNVDEDPEATNKCMQGALLTSEGRQPFFQLIFTKCEKIVLKSNDWNSYDRAFNLTVQIIKNFLGLRMKEEANQLVNCLEITVDKIEKNFEQKEILKKNPELRMLLRSKGFRYRLEILRLSKRSTRISICARSEYLRRVREQKVRKLFEKFLENEIRERNQESNFTPWTSPDNNLVVDFNTFIREEVGHKCKICATRPENFVKYFLYYIEPFSNYLLLGIDYLLMSGDFNPNKKIDEFGNTILHVIAKRSKLAFHVSAVPVAQLLIEKRFHVSRTNNKGETVLELLAKNFPDSALYRYLNQTINPSTSIKSLKFLSVLAMSQADFDLVTRSFEERIQYS